MNNMKEIPEIIGYERVWRENGQDGVFIELAGFFKSGEKTTGRVIFIPDNIINERRNR